MGGLEGLEEARIELDMVGKTTRVEIVVGIKQLMVQDTMQIEVDRETEAMVV